MTALEMFKQKYKEFMQRVKAREWEIINANAEAKKMTIPDYIMLNCIVITINDANPRKNADAYFELIRMNNDKTVASNRHRQYYGKVDAFWLTKKGLKEFNNLYNK